MHLDENQEDELVLSRMLQEGFYTTAQTSANKIKIHMRLQNLKVITYIIMACKLIL